MSTARPRPNHTPAIVCAAVIAAATMPAAAGDAAQQLLSLRELPQGEFRPVHPSSIATDGSVIGVSFASIDDVDGNVIRWRSGGEPENLGGGPSYALINITPVMSDDGAVIATPHLFELDQEPFFISVPLALRDETGWQPLSGLTLETSLPFGISANGSHITGAGGESGSAFQPWLWNQVHGQVVLPVPADRDGGEAWAASNDGRIAAGFVFQRDTDEWGWPITFYYGSRWLEGSWQPLTDGDGHALGQAVACTADCSILVGGGAGGQASHPRADHAWYWTEAGGGVYLDPSNLPPEALPPYYAIDISGDGSRIVGTYTTHVETEFGIIRVDKPFLWQTDTGMRSLGEMMAAHDIDFGGDGWELVANSISADGTRILLNGLDEDYQVRSAVLTIQTETIFADGFESQ